MGRIVTAQAGVSKPIRVALAGIPIDWTTILEAHDFSVPDPQVDYPADVDPARANRRIQPGATTVEAPLMIYNPDTVARWVEISILVEPVDELTAGVRVQQVRITIPKGDTYTHPSPGQRLLKLRKGSLNGDRLQVRAEVAAMLHLTAAASEGAAEQHQPSGGVV